MFRKQEFSLNMLQPTCFDHKAQIDQHEFLTDLQTHWHFNNTVQLMLAQMLQSRFGHEST